MNVLLRIQVLLCVCGDTTGGTEKWLIHILNMWVPNAHPHRTPQVEVPGTWPASLGLIQKRRGGERGGDGSAHIPGALPAVPSLRPLPRQGPRSAAQGHPPGARAGRGLTLGLLPRLRGRSKAPHAGLLGKEGMREDGSQSFLRGPEPHSASVTAPNMFPGP